MSYRCPIIFFLILIIKVSISPLLAQGDKDLPENLAIEVRQNIKQFEDLEKSGDFNQAAYFLNKAATVYWVNGFPEKAIELFKKTIELNQKIGNQNAIKTLYNNIGMVYTDEEDYPNALENFNKSLDVARQMNRKQDIASALLNVANVLSEQGSYKDAAITLDEASSIAKELNDQRLLRNCYSLLADIHEKLGNSQKSAEYFSLYTAISRKIQRDEARKRDSEAQQKVDAAQSKLSEVEKARQATESELLDKQKALKETEESLEEVEQISKERQMQIDLLSKEKELSDAIIKNQKLVRNVYLFIIFVILSFAILFFYNLNVKKRANALLSKQNREIAEQKDLIEQVNRDLEGAFNKIEKQNRDITSSINYAQRIQQAMFPAVEFLNEIIPDSFILLNPRDVVSGDFYWFAGYGSPESVTKKEHKNFIKLHSLKSEERGFIISAVDCTGHGIPGAFMSMIGFNLLETIVRNGSVIPNEILNTLHSYIRHLLKQKTTDNRDGMDMAICSIVDHGRKVLFSGAKNPLIYVSQGELNYLKGDPVPVGGMQKEERRSFTLHSIKVDKPTSFYIFSDGYTDQFGGVSGQKFGTKNLKDLLLEINELPMKEQKEVLKQKMKSWIGNDRKQIDDIIVIGFRVCEGNIDI